MAHSGPTRLNTGARRTRKCVIGDYVDRTILTKRVAGRIGYTYQDCQLVIGAFLDELQDSLTKGHNTLFKNIGVFEIRMRKEQVMHDPRNREPIIMPAGRVVRFRACYGLRKKLRELAP